MRLGRYQSTSAPSGRRARTRIGVEDTPSPSYSPRTVIRERRPTWPRIVPAAARRPPKASSGCASSAARKRRGRPGGGGGRGARTPPPRGGEGAARRRIGEAAAHEHLREHVRDAEIGAEALGGGEVVRGDVEV